MGTTLMILGAALLYLAAYHTYGKYLSKKIFRMSAENRCPSVEYHDGIDFVATDKTVLFGHHFTSIAGTGPIVGPAVAIIWGWLPALIWILFGSIFMGAVHDFGAMCISLKHQGRSIGDLAGDLISARVRLLFLLIICFTLWIVVAVFGTVIAAVFALFPESVLPCWLQIPIAVGLGWLVYRRGKSHLLWGFIAVVLMYLSMALGTRLPVRVPELSLFSFTLSPVGCWVILLLIYAYIASTLPVQTLLQPRDYINAFQLITAMLLLVLGILAARPAFAAPAVALQPAGAPPLWPMLFITVACGAVSGFHALVSSGTSSKQCDLETSALPIAYGGMLLEGFLAVCVLIACGAGLGLGLTAADGTLLTGAAAFSQQYANWAAADGLGAKVGAFITGSANMITRLGLPRPLIITIMGVFVASFAATTLDTATRIQRYIISELARAVRLPWLGRRHPATALAVLSALWLAFQGGSGGKGALILWPVFGAMNQLLAGLALLVITVWLARNHKPLWITVLPMLFMLGMTGWAMVISIQQFHAQNNRLLLVISVITLLLEGWMLAESAIVLRTARKPRA